MSNIIKADDKYQVGCSGCGKHIEISGKELAREMFFFCRNCLKKQHREQQKMNPFTSAYNVPASVTALKPPL